MFTEDQNVEERSVGGEVTSPKLAGGGDDSGCHVSPSDAFIEWT